MQWYTRFYYGRRTIDDERQVQRCKWKCTSAPVFALTSVPLNMPCFFPCDDCLHVRCAPAPPGLNLAGPSGRFSRSLMKKIANESGGGGAVPGNTALDDESVGRVLRQVNHQWAWVLNSAEWERRVGSA